MDFPDENEAYWGFGQAFYDPLQNLSCLLQWLSFMTNNTGLAKQPLVG